MFGKSKEEKQKIKTLKTLKKKQQQLSIYEEEVKKLKEEMIRMGKLALKNGKVVKSEDTVGEGQVQQAPPGYIPVPPSPRPQNLQQPPIQPQQPVPQLNPYEQVMQQPMQQPMQRPMQRQIFQQQEAQIVEAKIIVTGGESITVSIPIQEVDSFVRTIHTAINDQIVIELGQYKVNGRHIIYYIID